MPLPHLPFELILEIAEHLDLCTLNALVKTHRRAAETLTKRLYDRAFAVNLDAFDDPDRRIEDIKRHNVRVISRRMADCVPTWSSDLLVSYLLQRFNHDTPCLQIAPALEHTSMGTIPKNEQPFLPFLARAGNLKIIKLMIEAGAPVNAKDSGGNTLLHTACLSNNLALSRYLLSAGADLRIASTIGGSVAHPASTRGSTQLLTAIVAATGAANIDPLRPDAWGKQPLYIAASWNNLAAVEFWLAEGAEPTNPARPAADPLVHAISSGCRDEISKALIKAVLQRGGDLNYKLRSGLTLLHLATDYASEELVRYLVECGANIHLGDHNGMTPLHRAVKRKREAVIRTLVASGADPRAKDINATCPLELTRYYGRPDIVLLVLQGTPRMWLEEHVCAKLWKAIARCKAAECARGEVHRDEGYLKILLPLIRSDLSPFEPLDQHGNTALHLVCQIPNVQPGLDSPLIGIAKVLIDAGADVTAMNRKGLTPFHFAVWTPTDTNTHSDMVRFFLEYEGIHGEWDGQRTLAYSHAITQLCVAAYSTAVLSVDSSGKTRIDRCLKKIQDEELRKRAWRLLGWDQ
ncbi:ankyrin repeat-containing domain protein [Aspergillus karnatakaensis]|uniref:ankyrin repeat-containing domain protein n=1 Tax=Aspergillus karnatakaensis TaxID=1810916 RepID=UPI003CCCEC7D